MNTFFERTVLCLVFALFSSAAVAEPAAEYQDYGAVAQPNAQYENYSGGADYGAQQPNYQPQPDTAYPSAEGYYGEANRVLSNVDSGLPPNPQPDNWGQQGPAAYGTPSEEGFSQAPADSAYQQGWDTNREVQSNYPPTQGERYEQPQAVSGQMGERHPDSVGGQSFDSDLAGMTAGNALRQSYMITDLSWASFASPQGIYPGSTSNTPTGRGAEWGDLFFGISYQGHTRGNPNADGAVSAGLGFGDASKLVALETVVTVVDLLGDSGKDGTVSFKLHRQFEGDWAVSLGSENLLRWGDTDGGTSYYLVGSKTLQLKEDLDDYLSMVTLSLGVGNGRYRTTSNIRVGKEGVNVFGSVGLQLAPPVSFIADWTGQDLNVGFSIIPFRGVPISLLVAFADLVGSSDSGLRYIAGLALNLSWVDEWSI